MPPRPRRKLATPDTLPASKKLPSGWPSSRLLGSWMAKSGMVETLPLTMKRSLQPSLFTSANCACQAVEGCISPPM